MLVIVIVLQFDFFPDFGFLPKRYSPLLLKWWFSGFYMTNLIGNFSPPLSFYLFLSLCHWFIFQYRYELLAILFFVNYLHLLSCSFFLYLVLPWYSPFTLRKWFYFACYYFQLMYSAFHCWSWLYESLLSFCCFVPILIWFYVLKI